MNIPEIKKLEMGYVPSVEKTKALIEIEIANTTWAKDWEWMQHCVEIAEDFQSGQGTQELISTFSDQGLNLLRRLAKQNRDLMNYILQDTPENLYNRVSILGCGYVRCSYLGCKILLLMVNTEPAKVRAVYESKTFS
jgi:hypothetical protein